MRLPVSATLISWLAVCLCSHAAEQQTKVLPRHHPWGAFRPGAWKQVCAVIETLDENGFVKNTSTSETKTTLMSVDSDGVTLEVRVVQEVAGKRFTSEPNTLRQGFHGELLCPELKVGETRPGQVVVEGRTVPCQVLQFLHTTPTSKATANVYYSTAVAPFVLRRHTVVTDLEGNKSLSETSVNVTSLSWKPHHLPGISNTVLVGVVKKHAKGTIITWAVTSPEVPGGVVRQFSRELDGQYRLVRRSRLELTKFDMEPEDERVGLFGRRRPARPRKSKSTLRNPPR